MGLFKATTGEEVYRLRALSKEGINAITGRGSDVDFTKKVAKNILKIFDFGDQSTVVDVGCGDGSFLRQCLKHGFNTKNGKLIGILPSTEELGRVLDDLEESEKSIEFALGSCSQLGLNSETVDVIVCNSVLHLAGMSEVKVKEALFEFNRVLVTPPGKENISEDRNPQGERQCEPSQQVTGTGILFIGEMPDRDELQGKNYGDSITKWLIYILKNDGISKLILKSYEVLLAKYGSRNFIIAPKFMYFAPPTVFIQILTEYGFEVTNYWKFLEKDPNTGEMVASNTRWNYLARKVVDVVE
jgi:SAM-dependent methyltransferase